MKNVLKILEQLLNWRTVPTKAWIAPGNYCSIGQDRGKCATCGLNLLHIPQLGLGLLCSHHQIRNRPRQPLIHRPRLQQMRQWWSEFAVHSSADPVQWSSHRHIRKDPSKPVIHRPILQQMHRMWPQLFAHS